ncbi:lactadherin [Patella vulgata]|uniref:lactadherin n=1 Tax=Patella vulgata TaxID=6465 RepID=UPI00218027EF|nr:lactadherin [Patella vulgata]
MGLEQRSQITDVQFTASTSYDFSTVANQARLNNVANGRMVGAWIPRFKDDQQWIQIDLLHPKNITGIVTQGRPGHNQWVKSYIVRTSLDGVNFIPITDFGKTTPLIFAGNIDHETPKTQIFGQKISARFVRVYPVTFETSIALRLELLGCFVPAVTGTGTTSTTTQTTGSTPVTPPLSKFLVTFNIWSEAFEL